MIPTLGAFLILVQPAVAGAFPGADDEVDWPARGREIVAKVREHFFDAGRAAAWADRHATYADGVSDGEAFAAATRRALADLRTSHTAYYTKDDPEYYGLASIFRGAPGTPPSEVASIGVDVAPGGFVRKVFAGGPAEAAGIRRGDEIAFVDDQPFRPVASLKGKEGKDVAVDVRGRKDETVRRVILVPRKIDPKREWLEDQEKGARIVERRGRKVAYVPMFSGAGEEPQKALRRAILEKFAEADALVLDFRGGWGGANPDFVSIFDQAPPAFEEFSRDGVRTRHDPQWRKPLVLLVDGGSRSGKEVVAYAVRKHRLGTLVGRTTSGSVVGGRLFPTAGGLLYLAVVDLLIDGERLEGVGVPVDVEVQDQLPYAEGADPQLETALDVAANPQAAPRVQPAGPR